MRNGIFLSVFIICSTLSFATTWNEPWQAAIIKEADSFVFARIESINIREGIAISIEKNLAGKPLSGELIITNFYLLELGSYSVEITFSNFNGMTEGYFFLKQNNNGDYCISTPTSGVAGVKNSFVYATYRHSYHQALVPIDIYEKTMIAIFNNYHNQPYDQQFINDYVRECIARDPAKTGESLFFAQHVALETIYHLRLTGFYSNILPFLADISNFHNQVSAARALIAYNTPACKEELVKILSSEKEDDFVKVICVWTLSEFHPLELKERLNEIAGTASTEKNGFGGNLMDPRIGTFFPDVKSAIQRLVSEL
jgi:hypothetical protein